MERNQTWAAMYNVAERLTARYCEAGTLRVFARRHRHLTVLVEGLLVWDKWTDVFEPVGKRRVFSKMDRNPAGQRSRDRSLSTGAARPGRAIGAYCLAEPER